MKIIKAKLSDKKQVGAVLFELLNIKSAKEGEREFIKETKKGHTYLLAKDKGKVVGLVTFLMHGRPMHGLAELYHIVVLPDQRGSGAAQKLFDELEKEIKNEYKKAGGKTKNNLRPHTR